MNWFSRRRFLLGALGVLSVSWAYPRRAVRAARTPPDPDLEALAAALLPDRASAVVIAEAWRVEAPVAERDPGTVAQSLREALAPASPSVEALRERIRRDFRDEDVVRVRGWTLSRTEARLCVLAG